MGTKVSRNEPCPCGSGKKYKKCCIFKETKSVIDLDCQRIHKVHEGLIPKILEFVSREYGSVAIHEAWEEFHLFDESEFDPESHILQAFMPWFFYNWIPDPETSEVERGASFDVPPGEAMIASEGNKLSKFEIEYICACCNRAFSFYEVMGIDPGNSVDIKDLLTGEQLSVRERRGSIDAIKGNIFFGKVTLIQGMFRFEGLAPIQIPARFGLDVLDLREDLIKQLGAKITIENLFELEDILLELFWSFWDEIFDPTPPVVTNTDGHLFVPYKLIYEIESISEMFESLHSLCFADSREELLEGATYSKDERLIEINFSWLGKGNKNHKSWDNTVLGNIFLSETKMIVEVNSKERATRFKTLLTKKKLKGWVLKAMLVEPIESGLAESSVVENENSEISNEELMSLPEIKEQMEAMLKNHWENWLDEPLPALAGKSPNHAAKTKLGREKLELLLSDFEAKASTHPMPGQTVETFKEIRRRLNL